MTAQQAPEKKSIIRGTKEGALFLDVKELFDQQDVKELVEKLYNSNFRKRILEAIKEREELAKEPANK